MYKIRDCQFKYRYFQDEAEFKTKSEVAEQLIDYHSIDFSGADDKDNELNIYEYLDFYKIKTVKQKLDWVLEYGEWEIEKVKKHKLIIKSLFDAKAECNCGDWYYCGIGERTKKEIKEEFKKHLKQWK